MKFLPPGGNGMKRASFDADELHIAVVDDVEELTEFFSKKPETRVSGFLKCKPSQSRRLFSLRRDSSPGGGSQVPDKEAAE